MWRLWYQRTGFDVDRMEWVTANAGAVAAGSLGWKGASRDLIPQFRPDAARTNPGLLISYMTGRRGVKVSTYGR